MRVLVTGAAGYLGSVLCHRLIASGVEVVAVDSLVFGGAGLIGLAGRPGFRFVRSKGVDTLPWTATDGADAVVHLAALVGYPACHADPDRAIRINVGCTGTVLTAAHRFSLPLIYASTADIYAPRRDRSVCEMDGIAPSSEYAQTKVEAERNVLGYDRGIALRFATGCGVSPRMRLDLVFNDYCYRAVKDRYLCVYEAGFLRNFIHVEDMARAIQLALAAWPDLVKRPWNVTGPDDMVITKGALADEIGRRTGARIYHAGDEVGQDASRRDYRLDGSRLRAVLGYAPNWGIDATLAQVLVTCELIEVRDEYRNS